MAYPLLPSLCSLALCFLLVQFSSQQKDPIDDFCRRFGQQTAVIDRNLYIDGGLVDWNPIAQNPANYTNTFLLYQDLNSSPYALGMPQIYANLSKNGSIPDVSGGVLWADDVNKRFYLYGGDYFQNPPDNYILLSYDAIYNVWDSFGQPSFPINSVSWGAGVSISERGEGYYYGGWVSNTSEPNWSGGPLATTGLIKYSMDTNTWSNNTGPDSIPRAEGVMVFIPASDSGLLIYFGGITTPYGNSTMVGSPMSTIYIYDLASSQWYTQNATGDIPEMRRRFCAGATWASDQSSYNIYLYGGAGMAPNTTGFDDVYILSLPSFTWIKWYPAPNSGIGNPHNSMTCNVIDGAQMLVIGGTFPLSENCDAPTVWGTHNLDLGKQNSDDAMWHAYQPNITSYIVPPEIVSAIGGSSLGGATVTAPASGWSDRDLPVYFTREATIAARTPTRSIPTTSTSTPTPLPPHKPALSTGAIAGIAVGGALVLILLLLTSCSLIRRHRHNNRPPFPPIGPPSAVQSPAPAYSPHQYSNEPPNPYFHHTATAISELSGTTPVHEVMGVEPKWAPSSPIPREVQQYPNFQEVSPPITLGQRSPYESEGGRSRQMSVGTPLSRSQTGSPRHEAYGAWYEGQGSTA